MIEICQCFEQQIPQSQRQFPQALPRQTYISHFGLNYLIMSIFGRQQTSLSSYASVFVFYVQNCSKQIQLLRTALSCGGQTISNEKTWSEVALSCLLESVTVSISSCLMIRSLEFTFCCSERSLVLMRFTTRLVGTSCRYNFLFRSLFFKSSQSTQGAGNTSDFSSLPSVLAALKSNTEVQSILMSLLTSGSAIEFNKWKTEVYPSDANDSTVNFSRAGFCHPSTFKIIFSCSLEN